VFHIAKWYKIGGKDKSEGAKINIQGTRNVLELMKLAQQITGVPAPRIRVPPAMLKATSGLMSVVEKIVPVPETYTAEYLRVNAGVTYLGTNAKAVRELGYNPRSLEEGLPETLHHEMQLLGMK